MLGPAGIERMSWLNPSSLNCPAGDPVGLKIIPPPKILPVVLAEDTAATAASVVVETATPPKIAGVKETYSSIKIPC
jgi:ethanolamine utilization microcompartment shell protein EutL